MKTEILDLEVNWGITWKRIGYNTHGYHGLLKQWWDLFGLKGDGLVIGESGERGEALKKTLMLEYPKIKTILTVDFENADINWDITTPPEFSAKYDWIICQAVLEHCKDPVSAIKYMSQILLPSGLLFIHTHGPGFQEHRFPVDCYRYFRDALLAWAEICNLTILDLFWRRDNCFALYRKKDV